MAEQSANLIQPALPAATAHLSPSPLPISDPLPPAASAAASAPEPERESRQDSDEPRRRPPKRRLSPSGPTPPSRSPAPAGTATAATADPTDISHPPVLVPHTLSLPDSAFTFWATRSHPFNKLGFRYTPCGPSLCTPLPLPVPPQRAIESDPPGVRWSWEDRSPFTLLTADARTLTTDKGWRAARTVVGLRENAWYWEITVHRGGGEGGRDHAAAGGGGGEGEGSWVRVGVGRRESPLNAPVGIDGYSYGFRDKTGDAVTLAQPQPYGRPFGTSHTIGVYLSLPPRPAVPATDKRDPARLARKRIPIRYKGQLYFEQLEYAPSKEMDELLVDPALQAFKDRQAEEKRRKAKAAAPGTRAPPAATTDGPPLRPLPRLPGSQLAFFLDGECQGVAFEDLYDFLPLRRPKPPPGVTRKKDARALMENHHDDGAMGYFPMVSVFGGGIATINPGPDFAFPPPATTVEEMDAVLARSPHPPRRRRPADENPPVGGPWRPLCERYPEALAEQAYLDDLDEEAAVRRFLLEAKKAAADAAAAPPPPAPAEGGGSEIVAAPRLPSTSTPSGTASNEGDRANSEIATADIGSTETEDGPSKKIKTEFGAAAVVGAHEKRVALLGGVQVQEGAAAAAAAVGESPSPRPSAPLPSL